MTAALAIPRALEDAPARQRERIQVLESRPGVREVLIITASTAGPPPRYCTITASILAMIAAPSS